MNTCVGAWFGISGPLFSLVAGAAAGYFTAAREKAAAKGNNVRLGVISGGIAGAQTLD